MQTTHVETVSDLRIVWQRVLVLVSRDVIAMSRLVVDPVDALRGFGYELGPEAREALRVATAV